jgi:hypothetical protein
MRRSLAGPDKRGHAAVARTRSGADRDNGPESRRPREEALRQRAGLRHHAHRPRRRAKSWSWFRTLEAANETRNTLTNSKPEMSKRWASTGGPPRRTTSASMPCWRNSFMTSSGSSSCSTRHSTRNASNDWASSNRGSGRSRGNFRGCGDKNATSPGVSTLSSWSIRSRLVTMNRATRTAKGRPSALAHWVQTSAHQCHPGTFNRVINSSRGQRDPSSRLCQLPHPHPSFSEENSTSGRPKYRAPEPRNCRKYQCPNC